MASMIGQVPGFRSGKRWKKVVAVVGYVLIALSVFSGVTTGNAGGILLGLEGVLAVLIIANAWGLRSRLPLLRSPNRLVAGSGWLVFVTLGLGLFSAFSPQPPTTGTASKGSLPPLAVGTAVPAGAQVAGPTKAPATAVATVAPPTATKAPATPAPTTTKAPPSPTPVPSTPTPLRPTATPVPQKATATPPPPGRIEDLPTYLEAFLPPEAKGQIDLLPIAGGQGVSAMFTIGDNFASSQRTLARKYARDFVFAAYATGLPIRSAQIVVIQPDGKVGLAATLGANVATTQPASTWTSSSIGPSVFLDWMKDAAKVASTRSGADRAYIDGPWAD